ncbi:family 10 glycosylhydrolase, partial [bacterium]|nr:family 10 glycosylhydrolase [bacterium]
MDYKKPVELRGVWLTNVDSNVLDSQRSIAEAMHFLGEHHFNVVYPVVWSDAKTVYQSEIMDSLFGLPIDPR